MLKKILFSLLTLYLFIGFFLIPFVLKPQIISIVESQTNAKLTLENVYFNPLTCKLELAGLGVSSLDGEELAYFKSIGLNIELYSLLNSAIHVSEFLVEEPRISLVLDKDKQINFASIIKPSKETLVEDTNETTEIPRIILDRIAVIKARVNYEDYSNKSKFEFGLENLGFELRDIDTQSIQTKDASLRFYTKLEDGGFIDLNTKILSIEPLSVEGRLDYEASKLYSQWRYVKDKLNLEVADGKLSLNLDYSFNLEDLKATTLSNVNLSLDNLRVKPKDGTRDVLTLKSFYIDNATIKPLAQEVHLPKIVLDSLSIEAKRDEAKNIDWLKFIEVDSNKSTTSVEDNNTMDSPPWNVVLDSIALKNIKAKFIDKGIQPSVETSLKSLNIYAQNVTLDGTRPFKYQVDLELNEKLKCKLEGRVIHKYLDATSSVNCKNIDIEKYVPYIDEIAKKELKVYNVELKSLLAGFNAYVTLKDVDSSFVVNVLDADVHLDKFALNERSTRKKLVSFTTLDIKGINLNTATKEVIVKDTSLKHLNISALRLKDGSLNVEHLVVPHKTKTPVTVKRKVVKKEKDFRVQLKKVSLSAARLKFEDKTLSPSVKSKVDSIYVTLKDIDSKKYTWMNYYVSARINGSGKLKTSGALRHTPLKQKGKIELNRLSIKEINPYLREHMYTKLDDGYLSFKTQSKYAVSKNKPDLNLEGNFKVEEFFISDTRDKSTLSSFSSLNLKEFTLELSPNRLFVNEIDVEGFFVNALVDANKTINFAKLMKNDLQATKLETSEKEAKSKVSEPKENAFPLKIMKVNIINGSAIFSDESLPIHFKTDIHDFNGQVLSISNAPNEVSYIDLVGEIDKYGSTKLKGSVNSADPKVFTDLDFNFRNLDLSAMSGYSSTFAGHKIDSGKLFLNLNYDIKDSKLQGENSIIIKKIKLGDEVDIEGGALPLGFVIALLEDSDGIIDIDMPIRGNLDEPDFKYGALVWKTFGNLILKAVTSPFRFLGSMLGIGGEELEYAEFEGGSFSLLPSEREKMDNVAKLLTKRPKMNLSISGGYDIEVDKVAMQKQKLIVQVIKRSDAKNEKERINAMTTDLLEDIYEDVRDDDKLEKIEDALEEKYKDEKAFERAYLLALVKECTLIQVVTLQEIQSLAEKRSNALKAYLVDSKGLLPSRVSEIEIVEFQSDEKKLIQTKLDVVVK